MCHTHTNSPTITPPSLLYFLFPSCFSMLSLSLEKLVTCGVIRSYNGCSICSKCQFSIELRCLSCWWTWYCRCSLLCKFCIYIHRFIGCAITGDVVGCCCSLSAWYVLPVVLTLCLNNLTKKCICLNNSFPCSSLNCSIAFGPSKMNLQALQGKFWKNRNPIW